MFSSGFRLQALKPMRQRRRISGYGKIKGIRKSETTERLELRSITRKKQDPVINALFYWVPKKLLKNRILG